MAFGLTIAAGIPMVITFMRSKNAITREYPGLDLPFAKENPRRLAFRALGWGTFYAFAGVGIGVMAVAYLCDVSSVSIDKLSMV